MDITNFVISGRDQSLLYGDYTTYRTSLSRRLLATRKRLGQVTKKGAKYTKKAPVTAGNIAQHHGFAHLVLLTAERAWAHAMSMKAAHSADANGVTGSTRSHIISRLHKASTTLDELIIALGDRSASGASEQDLLEARAYAASLSGAEEFERQGWQACVKSYSESWIIYTVLAAASKGDIFKDILSETIEPSIRYGAYQMKMPRTVAVAAIARKHFPRADSELVALVQKLDSSVLRDGSKAKTTAQEAEATSRTITWRSRTVDLEDAAIAVALGSVDVARRALSETLATTPVDRSKDRAAAYDEILIASQDAVDATKHAIDELAAEGLVQGDRRMQSLQITRTAVSYDMISWRIGRNRVLTGKHDGALIDSGPVYRHRKAKKAQAELIVKEDGAGRQLARLREKLVMYDSTLQSLDSIRELPGVAADTAFLEELDAEYQYFRALKCLVLARSHSILSEHRNALALLARASDQLSSVLPTFSTTTTSLDSPPSSAVSAESAKFLFAVLNGELQRHRALVELSNLSRTSHPSTNNSTPLIECLDAYPEHGVDLQNIITYPPKFEPIPVKPLFFDVAWNYVAYPGRTSATASESALAVSAQPEKASENVPQQKKGWFGFGR